MKTTIYNVLDTAKDNIRYDEYVKRVLSTKDVLARILKRVTEEFRPLPVEQIAQECLDTDIQIGTVPIAPGMTNTRTADDTVPDMIIGDATENKVPGEGVVNFDIRFHARSPAGAQNFRLIINIEGQKDPYPKYELVTRGIFYGARLISAQLDTEFKNSEYDKIIKVYSIWIVMNAPNYIGNTICLWTII